MKIDKLHNTPEVKETEDERIRKEIMSYIKSNMTIFGLKTKVYSIEKAWDLVIALRKGGAEGPQNDSLRYVPEYIYHAFRDENYCWIGLCGKHPRHGYIRIISNHDGFGKKSLLDVSESKFIELLNLKVEKTELPKSLRHYKNKS